MKGSTMKRGNIFLTIPLFCVAALLPVLAAGRQPNAPQHKPDLADAATGTYFGDVISDSKGSSKNNVTVFVTRIGKNRVQITSDYARLPTVEVLLTRAMGKILNKDTSTTFLLDRSATPPHLDVSFLNEVSWTGSKR
jgi:hypothetical protein